MVTLVSHFWGAVSEEEKWVESIEKMSSSQMIQEYNSTRDESVFPDITIIAIPIRNGWLSIPERYGKAAAYHQ